MRPEPKPGMLCDDWHPAEAYPAVVQVPDQGGNNFVYSFPDFEGKSVTTDALSPPGTVKDFLKSLILRRRRDRSLIPFASKPSTLEGIIVMVPTVGWESIEEEDHPE